MGFNWRLKSVFNILPNKFRLVAVIVFWELLNLLFPLLMGFAINCVNECETGFIIWWLLSSALGVQVILLFTEYYKDILVQKSFGLFNARFTVEYWTSISQLPLDRFMKIPVGVWLEKMSYDTNMVSFTLRHLFCSGFGLLFSIIACVIMLTQCSWFFIVVILCSVSVGIFFCFLLNKRSLLYSGETRSSYYAVSDFLNNLVLMHPLLSVFQKSRAYIPFLFKFISKVNENECELQRTFAKSQLCVNLLFWIVQSLVLATCFICIIKENMTLGALFTCIILMSQVFSRLSSAIQLLPPMIRGVDSYKGILETLSFNDTVVDREIPFSSANSVTECVTCERISFGYNEKDLIIKDFTATFKKGDFCVLLGRNGAGKSTLAKILLGILKPSTGRMSGISLIKGWVPQAGVIFKDSLLENIRLYNLSISEKDVEDALEACGLLEWEQSLPKGLHTKIESNSISGGQLQLLSLARAMVQNPDLLVIDEISNNLDIVMKHKIYTIVKKCAGKRCVILVSHDFDSIKMATRIMLFEKDRIIELPCGTSENIIRGLLSEQ